MSEEETKEGPKLVSTEPPTQIEELDRLRIQEAWLEKLASQQAMAGLAEQQARLVAEQQLNLEQKNTHQRIIDESQTKLEALMKEIKAKYEIPEHYQIDSKTGAIAPTPPQSAQ